MRTALLDYLACPHCIGPLTLSQTQTEGDHIISGAVTCQHCSVSFPIVRGVPRLVVGVETDAIRQTGDAFGFSWRQFSHISPLHRQQFLEWISPLGPTDMTGRVILDAGCGKGRHTLVTHGFGPKAIIGVDLSDAVDVAFEVTRPLEHAHIVQANIYRLPFRPATFDSAYSVGVLHHLPDPAEGFARVFEHLKPGGRIAIWVYGRENNEWIVKLVNPLREHLFTRLPKPVLLALSAAVTAPLFVALKGVYGPLNRLAPQLAAQWLPYNAYCAYIARFPWQEIYNIVFDQLVAPVSFYLPRAEVARWFERSDADHVQIAWHNRNSWRGYAVRGG